MTESSIFLSHSVWKSLSSVCVQSACTCIGIVVIHILVWPSHEVSETTFGHVLKENLQNNAWTVYIRLHIDNCCDSTSTIVSAHTCTTLDRVETLLAFWNKDDFPAVQSCIFNTYEFMKYDWSQLTPGCDSPIVGHICEVPPKTIHGKTSHSGQPYWRFSYFCAGSAT